MDHAELRQKLVAMAGSLTDSELELMAKEAERRRLPFARWARGVLVGIADAWAGPRGMMQYRTQHARNSHIDPGSDK